MRMPWLIGLAILLQEATNRLLFRRFTIALGILRDRGPAIIMQTRRVFGKSETIMVDLNSFLLIAKDVAETDDRILERQGFVINKKDKMDRDFHIPNWAFPKALYEMVLAGKKIVQQLQELEEAAERAIKLMKEAGFSDEDIEKLKQGYTAKGTQQNVGTDRKET